MLRDISAVEVPTEERGVTGTHLAPQPKVPGLGRGVPTASGCANQQGPRTRKAEGSWRPTRRPDTVHGLLLSETLGSGTDGSSMSARDAQGETERTGLGVGAGGTAGGWLSAATNGLVGATAPCRVRPTPSWQKQAGAGCELSIRLVLPRPRFAQLTR